MERNPEHESALRAAVARDRSDTERVCVASWPELTDRCEEETELESIAIRIELDEPLQSLLVAVQRAASELEGQGAKSDRISQQLYTALAVFHRETGT